MRRTLLAALAAAVLSVSIFGGPAAAASSCGTAVERFTTKHTSTWQAAGPVQMVCEASGPTGEGGYFDGEGIVHLYPAGAKDWDAVIAHEMGHAWLVAQARDDRYVGLRLLRYYALIRGFLAPGATASESRMYVVTHLDLLKEDHAETFAYALGEWADLGGVYPYAFQHLQGVPTEGQLYWLRVYEVLPG